MLARLLILIARGRQQARRPELPLHAELLGLCNHRSFPLWRAPRRVARRQAPAPLPSLGGIRRRSGTMSLEGPDPSERT